MARALAVVLLCLIASPAGAFQVNCDDVRAFVAQHGKAVAIAFAVSHGATWQQIREAKKCLLYSQ